MTELVHNHCDPQIDFWMTKHVPASPPIPVIHQFIQSTPPAPQSRRLVYPHRSVLEATPPSRTSFSRFRAPVSSSSSEVDSSSSEVDDDSDEERYGSFVDFQSPGVSRFHHSQQEKKYATSPSLRIQWEKDRQSSIAMAVSESHREFRHEIESTREETRKRLRESVLMKEPADAYLLSLHEKEKQMMETTVCYLAQLKLQHTASTESVREQLEQYKAQQRKLEAEYEAQELKQKQALDREQAAIDKQHAMDKQQQLLEQQQLDEREKIEKEKQAAERAEAAIVEQERQQVAERKAHEQAQARAELEQQKIANQQEQDKQDAIKQLEQEKREEKNRYTVSKFQERTTQLSEIHKLIEPIISSTDAETKKLRLEVKKKLGEACNQISSKPSSIRLVVQKLTTLLDQALAFGKPYHVYAMDQMAVKLTARTKILTDFPSCFPIAHVITMVCVHTHALGPIIIGHLNRTCVYTIPTPGRKKSPTETIDAYKLSLGFEKDASTPDGFESFEKYCARVTISVALYAATLQSTPWNSEAEPPEISVVTLWSWFAAVVNEPPHLLTAPILLAALEVAGFELLRVFKRQFHKILVVILKDVCPRLSQDTKTGSAAAAARLGNFVQAYFDHGCTLNEPEGRVLRESQVSEADEEQDTRDQHSSSSSRHSHHSVGRGRGRGRGRRY